MPVDRASQRHGSALSRRDRRFLAALACAGALGIGGGAFAYAGGDSARGGCVTKVVASTMGGATIRTCAPR
jgi:hypothetical protein